MLRLLLFFLILGSTLMVSAQKAEHPNADINRPPDEIAKMRTDRMASGLELTETQKSKVYNINLKYAKKRQLMMKSQFMTAEEKRNEKRKMGEDYSNELKAVLNSEQYQKFANYRADQKNGKVTPAR